MRKSTVVIAVFYRLNPTITVSFEEENEIFIVFKKAIMKKLLYLLFAITLLGCGSNDDDNVSAQTFLEKYDGVMWRVDDFTYDHYDYGEYLTFNNSTQVLDKVFMKEIFVFDQQDSFECDEFEVGYFDEDNTTFSIIETEDKLIIEIKDEDTQNKGTIFFKVTNGKLSTDAYSDITYSVTNLEDPCD